MRLCLSLSLSPFAVVEKVRGGEGDSTLINQRIIAAFFAAGSPSSSLSYHHPSLLSFPFKVSLLQSRSSSPFPQKLGKASSSSSSLPLLPTLVSTLSIILPSLAKHMDGKRKGGRTLRPPSPLSTVVAPADEDRGRRRRRRGRGGAVVTSTQSKEEREEGLASLTSIIDLLKSTKAPSPPPLLHPS